MDDRTASINSSYEHYYAQRKGTRVYPTEFVVRTFLASYPKLVFQRPIEGARILDIGFGDGRNTAFLCEQNLDVSGIEITQGIVDQTQARLTQLGYRPDLRVGRNSSIPFADQSFDYVLACHCAYYCDDGETISDNLVEYARVMKPGAWLTASLACRSSYIFDQAQHLPDGSYRITSDPYQNRIGYRLWAFEDTASIETQLAPWFETFSFGFANNDFYGVSERVFWVVCRKR